MSRLELAGIPSLTFYKDSLTTARRTSPIQQLICKGVPCKLYQPEVVRCVSLPGGYGTEVDWKCEADLPESLRFGRVEVSCEGWSKPGDPYVLKGSCSLEYRLVQVPGVFRDSDKSFSVKPQSYDISTTIFFVVWVGILLFILYSFFVSCLRSQTDTSRRPGRPPSPHQRPSSGWFPGAMDNDQGYQPPPPYSKTSNTDANQPGWRPGFWTGAAVGGAANHLWNRAQAQPQPPRQSSYDWERPQPQSSLFNSRQTTSTSARNSRSDDRGEGPSNLGSMRRSTGLGGSNVR